MYPLSKAELNIICLANNPTNGGTPTNENSFMAKLKTSTIQVLDKSNL